MPNRNLQQIWDLTLMHALENEDTSNQSAVKDANYHASMVMADCAAADLKQGHIRSAVASIAASFHAGNIVAMTMHMKGDDSSAQRLISQLRSQESHYLSIAKQNGYSESVIALQTASDETETIASRL